MTFTTLTSSEDRAAWLEARQQGVTATDVSRLAHGGHAEWVKLKGEKAGIESFHGNQHTRWGSSREEVIAETLGDLGLHHNTCLLRQDDDPRWLATPDLIDDGATQVGDIKTAVWSGEKWDDPPAAYRDQVLWQMFVTGARKAVLVVEYHEDFRVMFFEPDILHIAYDEDRVAYLVELAEKFLAMGEVSEMDVLLARRLEAMEAAKEAKAEQDAVDALILAEIGDRDSFKHVSDLGSISFSKPKPRNQFMTEKFRENYPDLYDDFTVEGKVPKPSIRVTPAKEKQ